MNERKEKLFISKQIPGLDTELVIDALGSTIEDLRVYFDKREAVIMDRLIDEIESPLEANPDDLISGFDMTIDVVRSGDQAVILRDGTVLLNGTLDLHLITPDDDTFQPRAELARLAGRVAERDLAASHPLVLATTYPKLARLAEKMLGMEYAVATYFPATETAQDSLDSINHLENKFRARNGIQLTPHSHVESLVMKTEDFIDRFAD